MFVGKSLIYIHLSSSIRFFATLRVNIQAAHLCLMTSHMHLLVDHIVKVFISGELSLHFFQSCSCENNTSRPWFKVDPSDLLLSTKGSKTTNINTTFVCCKN